VLAVGNKPPEWAWSESCDPFKKYFWASIISLEWMKLVLVILYLIFCGTIMETALLTIVSRHLYTVTHHYPNTTFTAVSCPVEFMASGML